MSDSTYSLTLIFGHGRTDAQQKKRHFLSGVFIRVMTMKITYPAYPNV
jgi:hypothetical protein